MVVITAEVSNNQGAFNCSTSITHIPHASKHLRPSYIFEMYYSRSWNVLHAKWRHMKGLSQWMIYTVMQTLLYNSNAFVRKKIIHYNHIRAAYPRSAMNKQKERRNPDATC